MNKPKELKDYLWDDLVDEMVLLIHKRLLSGDFHGGVWLALNTAIRWSKEAESLRKKK